MNHRWLAALLACLTAFGCRFGAPGPVVDGERLRVATGDGPRVLGVVAHPDDEIAFSATMFKIATHLGGACDLAVLTNGEAGYRYSTLAERIYGAELTDPAVGRALLPGIRRRELVAACSILGIRQLWLFGERDHRNTPDPNEVLAPDAGVWDLERVRRGLAAILLHGRYDFVFTHLPEPGTHGHHKAATILALEAVADLPVGDRPVVLGAHAGARPGEERAPFAVLEGHPITRVRDDCGPFAFDRTQTFGYRNRLDYHIVVNWAIAEHKSQGTYQRLMNRWDRELFAVFALQARDAPGRAERLFESLRQPQFPAREHAPDGPSLP